MSRKIYTNTLAQIVAKLTTAFISIFLIKVLISYLGLEWYGMYTKVYNYLSIFAVIADLGLYTITVREIAEHREDHEKTAHILGNTLSLRAMMGIIIIVSSLLLALILPGYGGWTLSVAILITGFFTLFGLVNSSLMTYLQAHLQTERAVIGVAGGKFLTFWLILLSAFAIFPFAETTLFSRLTIVMLAGLAGNILMTMVTYFYLRRLVVVRFLWDRDYIREISRKALPYGIALFLNTVFFKVDILLLSLLEESAIVNISIALYSVPMKIIEVGMLYGTVFLNSLLPELSTHLQKEKYEPSPEHHSLPSHTLIRKGYILLLFFGLGISAFLASFPREILTIIANPDYISTLQDGYSGLDVMRVVSWIFCIYFLSSLSTYILIAQGSERKMISINAFIAIINIIGNLALIPTLSFYGSSLASLISQILLFLLTTYQVRSVIPWSRLIEPTMIFIGLGLVSSLSSLLIWGGGLSRLIIGVILFAIIYLGGGILWWWKRR